MRDLSEKSGRWLAGALVGRAADERRRQRVRKPEGRVDGRLGELAKAIADLCSDFEINICKHFASSLVFDGWLRGGVSFGPAGRWAGRGGGGEQMGPAGGCAGEAVLDQEQHVTRRLETRRDALKARGRRPRSSFAASSVICCRPL